ncbi:MAG: inositol monophosphatase [Candidatus Omnitrophica bacterium]|nr:inositol monophosphatase [Candidatus Omnitrophota bacterium]MBD3269508.1 inositol monophosphatase [Candidatus Omnitrophota bacterium]
MEYVDIAVRAAKEAGKVHHKFFRRKINVKTKSSSFDLVTSADIKAEAKIVEVIEKYCPGHNFLAEENKYPLRDSEYTWVIDPLDGTNNFSAGLPIFCSSIALMKGEEIIMGVIYDASRDELFTSLKGKGAFLNGRKIKVSPAATLKESLLITGFYYDRGQDMAETLDNIKDFFLRRIMGLRRLGAAALDLCYVACGRAAGFWEFHLSPWDFCAGKIIVEEAGGKVTDKRGDSIFPRQASYVVASNGKIHKKMLEVLNK